MPVVYQFRYRSQLHHRLECTQRRFKYAPSVSISKQWRLQPRSEWGQLCLGDADDNRLRSGLPLQFLWHGNVISEMNETVGRPTKDSNDALASLGSNRIMGQQCGQTWLKTFSEINGLYSSGKQLPDLQLVTWNDYEEGTEIESGIDNCVTLSGAMSANTLQWTISGNENTVDHYTVYISTDGQNLMSLTDLATGLHSVNLCSFPIPSGNYTLYVQATGKASMANQMSGALSYTPSCVSAPPPPPPPSLSLSALSPSSVTILAGQAGSLTVTANPQSGTFSSPVALSCTGLPTGWNCSFSPASLTIDSTPVNSALTIAGGVPFRPPTCRRRGKRSRSTPPGCCPWELQDLRFAWEFTHAGTASEHSPLALVIGLKEWQPLLARELAAEPRPRRLPLPRP